MSERIPAAGRLRGKLRGHDRALRMYMTDAQYHTYVDCTSLLLDIVDEVTDAATAARIADAIYEHLVAEDVHAAAARIRVAEKQIAQMRNEPPAWQRLRFPLGGDS